MASASIIGLALGAPLVFALAATTACKGDDNPRQAFVGTFAFASTSFQTDCAPVPEDHQTIDREIEVVLDGHDQLEVDIDSVTVPCHDELDLASEPRRVGCELTRGGVTYLVQLRIDNSYDHPNRMNVVKTFDDPACSLTASGTLTEI